MEKEQKNKDNEEKDFEIKVQELVEEELEDNPDENEIKGMIKTLDYNKSLLERKVQRRP